MPQYFTRRASIDSDSDSNRASDTLMKGESQNPALFTSADLQTPIPILDDDDEPSSSESSDGANSWDMSCCPSPDVDSVYTSESNAVADYAFAFDIDGVLLKGGTVIPEAIEALKVLNGRNEFGVMVPYIFVTNVSSSSLAIFR